MALKQQLTVETARALLSYNPETGALSWLERDASWFTYPNFHTHWNKRWAGKVVGTRDARGYLVFNALNRTHTAHRAAWLIHHGREPEGVIDHINGDGGDNRPENLVPSCRGCNTARGLQRRSDMLRAEGFWSGSDTVAALRNPGRRARIDDSGELEEAS